MKGLFIIIQIASNAACKDERLRANNHNIVGQQLPTFLGVTCCVRLHTLLNVVACCWELLCED